MNNQSAKYIILVGDGMGDLPLPELNGQTPLEAARTPAMDYVASHGKLALLRTIPVGFAPGSDVANLSLLGYRPELYYTGRAPLEAASMGINLAADEIAFRCNLVTIDYQNDSHVRMVDYSAGHIDTSKAHILIEALNKELADNHIRFYGGVSYRHLLIAKEFSEDLQTAPPHDYTGQNVSRLWQQYLASPLRDLVLAAHEILQHHPANQGCEKPANAIWLWGEGKMPAMPRMPDLYGISGSLISAVDLLKGIGKCAGLDIINVPGATGYLDTNYQGKADAALKAIKEKDFVLVHVEAPDEAGHQGLLKEKIQAIEDFDQKIVQPILDGLRNSYPAFRLAVAMDHFTPLSIKTHADYPVPVTYYDSSENSNGSGLSYSEANGAKTGKIYQSGDLFMKAFLGKVDK